MHRSTAHIHSVQHRSVPDSHVKVSTICITYHCTTLHFCMHRCTSTSTSFHISRASSTSSACMGHGSASWPVHSLPTHSGEAIQRRQDMFTSSGVNVDRSHLNRSSRPCYPQSICRSSSSPAKLLSSKSAYSTRQVTCSTAPQSCIQRPTCYQVPAHWTRRTIMTMLGR